MKESEINVALLYPCDPSAPLIGGVESFIRGLIVNAPESIHYYVIGATTDHLLRPVGKWTNCQLDGVSFKYFPLYEIQNRAKRALIPATIQYEVCALLRMPSLSFADVIESHRIEHLLFRAKHKPFSLFLHQNMAVLNNPKSDILWKSAPGLYRFLEKKLIKRQGNVFCVREDAVNEYKSIFPLQANKFHFQPTWVNEKVFFPVSKNESKQLRAELCNEYCFEESKPLALTVGRIDSQKDPLLMVDAVASVREKDIYVQVIWIGDGVLKESIIKRINEFDLSSQFKLAGFKDATYIANAIRGSDFFLMSSAYEGMPFAVLEALACGRPVVSTRVGEVPRLIEQAKNGFLASPGDISSLSKAIMDITLFYEKCAENSCLDVARMYLAKNVLQQVYESYL